MALVPGAFAAAFLANGYSVRVWQTDDGLPQNLVTSVAQTDDGYLWFGTSNGLARFDGKRFNVFNPNNTPAFADRRVSCLFVDPSGVLWIGHDTGHITRYWDDQFAAFSTPRTQELEKVVGIGSDEDGRVWAMRENGAVDCLDNGERLPSLIANERPAIMNWTRGSDGQIWLMENGSAIRLQDGALRPMDLGGARSDNYVVGLAASKGGGVWLLVDEQIRRRKDGEWVEDLGGYPWNIRSSAHCLELDDGTLAVGTINYGLYLMFRDGRPPIHFDVENGLPQNWIRCVFQDREGTLWVGVGSAGLVSLRPTAFSVLSLPEPWTSRTVLSVASGSDGGLWVGTDGSGLFHYNSGDWARYEREQGLDNPYIPSVVEDSKGNVWAGSHWWGGPYRLKNGQFSRPPNVDPSWSVAIALLPIPGSDRLLVGNRDGVLELVDGETSRWLVKSPEGGLDDATALALAPDGAIWCGFARGGLARIAGGEVTHFRQSDGLASDSVHCLLADEDGSIWIGTADSGLSRFKDGMFSNISTAEGLVDNVICSILDDGRGYFWMSTYHGIQRISKKALQDCADGLVPSFMSQVYDRNDGLPVVEFAGGRQGAACRTDDGILYFASSKGVARIDPGRIEPNPHPPPVVIDSFLVDGRSVDFQSGQVGNRLPPSNQRIAFQYAGLSFAAPSKVAFKYRLDGIDDDWISVGSDRSAFYSHLPAGHYRFRVIACNNDGVWNTEGASLAFAVAPFFWETWWFVGATILLVLTSVAVLVRYATRRRMQRRIEAMERSHAIERERSRIAQDIHDDVGASLSRIAMLSQPSRYRQLAPERVPILEMINTTARRMTHALDEIVWAVNPRHDTLDSLADYIGKFAHSFLSSAEVQCRLDIPIDVPANPLSAEMRHNLFLAYKEALNNAVKHAGASEVRVSLAFEADRLILVVKDNGQGFDAGAEIISPVGRPGAGNGLWNMKERMRRTGGSFKIDSEQNVGTSVTFVVDLPASAQRKSNVGSGS